MATTPADKGPGAQTAQQSEALSCPNVAVPTASTQQQVSFQGSAHGAFHLMKDLNVPLKVEQSVATKFHKPHPSGFIPKSPAPRVM